MEVPLFKTEDKSRQGEFKSTPLGVYYAILAYGPHPFFQLCLSLLRIFYPMYLYFFKSLPLLSFNWISRCLSLDISSNFISFCLLAFNRLEKPSPISNYIFYFSCILPSLYFLIYLFAKKSAALKSKRILIKLGTISFIVLTSMNAVDMENVFISRDIDLYIPIILKTTASIFILYVSEDIEKYSNKMN